MNRFRRHGRSLAAAVLLILGALPSAQSRDGERRGEAPDPARLRRARPAFACGTRDRPLIESAGPAAGIPLPVGQPVYFTQAPPVIRPDITTNIRITVTVVGDHPSLQIVRNDPDRNDPIETWPRTGTASIDGYLVSHFAKSYPPGEFIRVLRRQVHGFDYPSVYWGDVRVPGSDDTRLLTLRVASTNLPASPVTRIDDTVQYSSHVVNLAIPGYGNSRITSGDHGFDEQRVARLFYEHFQDIYHVLAIVPQQMHLAPFGAFHTRVSNAVQGINIPLFNNSSAYGSGGMLEGVEVYCQTGAAENGSSNHELTHQWGHRLDWTGIAGVTRAGHEPQAHAPLWAFGETFVGAVLEPTRRVQSRNGGYEIERSASPARHHPIDLYLMGKLQPSEVPDVLIFEDQGQFGSATTAPDVHTSVAGATRPVNINAILQRHGPRSGPSPGLYRRALIYVSGTLASQAEMNYWNFLAQRSEDPRGAGVVSFDGIPSFDVATWKTVDLDTDIHPKTAPKVSVSLSVDFPAFGRTDIPGVAFDQVVPGRYIAGRTVRLTGKVTATDRRDYSEILLRFFTARGDERDYVRFYAPVSRSGLFSVDVQFTAAQRGPYGFDVLLFWNGGPPQFPRGAVSPVHVQ